MRHSDQQSSQCPVGERIAFIADCFRDINSDASGSENQTAAASPPTLSYTRRNARAISTAPMPIMNTE
jgi:hypothetical protein